MVNGIICVYKEKGYTSHDVVAKIRKIFNQKKVGHTGTLDPEAVGVLPVCLGKATKVSSMLTDTDKVYETTLKLGITTDTQDSTGKIIEEKEVNISEVQIKEVINKYIGEYYQIPPMYSAIKVKGKKLYELAREGIEVEREPRKVYIYNIEILNYSLDTIFLRVYCSKGTYIRTLCYDIGKNLGCGAHMSKLERTKVGCFDINTCYRLDTIEQQVKDIGCDHLIIPIDELFKDYAKAVIIKKYESLLYNGNILSLNTLNIDGELINNNLYRIYDSGLQFIGIYKYFQDLSHMKPMKVFL